jgi:hypothetical protein
MRSLHAAAVSHNEPGSNAADTNGAGCHSELSAEDAEAKTAFEHVRHLLVHVGVLSDAR